jgi:serine/threonine protein kinase
MNRDSIRSGGNANVYEAEYRNTAVALKMLRITRSERDGSLKVGLSTALVHEALIWRYAKHPNVLPFLGYCPEMESCLVTEWMHNGNLVSFVKDNPECDHRQLVRSSLIATSRCYISPHRRVSKRQKVWLIFIASPVLCMVIFGL